MPQPKITIYKELKISQYRPKIRDVYQIVSWNNGEPLFEIRRQFKNNTDEEWRMSHARGIRKDDLEWLLDNIETIKKYLNKAIKVWEKTKHGK